MMPISDAERWRWQRQAVRVLDELLELAEVEGLPPVTWTVSPRLQLMARVGVVGSMAGEYRPVFSAWRSHLDLVARPEFVDHFGVVRLSAHGEYRTARFPVMQVSLFADFDDLAMEQGAGHE